MVRYGILRLTVRPFLFVVPWLYHMQLPAARLSRKQNPAQFKSLISFGEVLDPASKAAVLSLDSQVQMQGTINNEFQVRAGPHHGKISLITEKGCVAVRSPSCNVSSLVYSSINS